MKKSKTKDVKKSSNSKNKILKNNHKNKNISSKINSFFKENKAFIIGSIIFLVLLLILLTFQFNSTGKVITGYDNQEESQRSFNIDKGLSATPVNTEDLAKISKNPAESDEIIKAKWVYNGKQDSNFGIILGLIFGDPIIITTKGSATNIYSGIVVIIAVWILLFVTFSDIIKTFSTFNKGVSWVSGFLIATISAQMNFLVSLVSFLAKTFAFLGSLSVFIGLGAAFLAFLAVNLGIASLSKFVLKRKMMRAINNAEISSEMMKNGAKNLVKFQEALQDVGKKIQDKGIS
jgi:hypothetical protein